MSKTSMLRLRYLADRQESFRARLTITANPARQLVAYAGATRNPVTALDARITVYSRHKPVGSPRRGGS